MAEQPSRQPRGPRTGTYPGIIDPIHDGHLDIIRRATLFDFAEDEHGVPVARLVGVAEPNEPGQTVPEDTHSAAAVQTDPAAAVIETNPRRTVLDRSNPVAAIQTNPRAATAVSLSRADDD